MALQPTELYSANAVGADPPWATDGPGSLETRAYAAGTGTLPLLQAVGVVTASGLYAPWDPAAVDGSEVIFGFAAVNDGLVLSAAGEVNGLTFLKGSAQYAYLKTLHVDDLGVATEPELQAALRNVQLRNFGLIIEGLTRRP